MLVYDRSSHQICYYNCKSWLIGLYLLAVLIRCDFINNLVSKSGVFIREGGVYYEQYGMYKSSKIRHNQKSRMRLVSVHVSLMLSIVISTRCLKSSPETQKADLKRS